MTGAVRGLRLVRGAHVPSGIAWQWPLQRRYPADSNHMYEDVVKMCWAIFATFSGHVDIVVNTLRCICYMTRLLRAATPLHTAPEGTTNCLQRFRTQCSQ